jgi:hypothetical protein
MNMRLKEREIAGYAEPVEPEKLVAGDVYFALQFADEQLLIPTLEALMFLGRNLAEASPEDLFVFPELRLLSPRFTVQICN